MYILAQLADHARERVAAAKKKISPEEIRAAAEKMPRGDFPFNRVLAKPSLSFICECKKASPSKGIIAEEFPYKEIAAEYAAAGADAISVLTEPKYFLGSSEYLRQIATTVNVPCLRKDFTVDEYMIYEAKTLGAAAVLLIVAILDKTELAEYMAVADSLGLSALVEAHDATEIETALTAGAKIIGVNNRNLKNFAVDTGTSLALRKLVPPDVLFVAESGITSATDAKKAHDAGADAVLIGETHMRAANKGAKLKELKSLL